MNQENEDANDELPANAGSRKDRKKRCRPIRNAEEDDIRIDVYLALVLFTAAVFLIKILPKY